ncbi:MAG: type II toxin-antitoxin system RelE/ParE family toxin [Burkholderiales bacterium]|nr:type II toxin-antitoxin system RelE/ParE family toxin [Burkholderiales bacterium]
MPATRQVVLRALAVADADAAIEWYLEEAGPEVALGFIDALQAANAHIARHPGTGSLRWGQALDIPGLRCWRLSRFPFLVFYFETQAGVDVWRVLHAERDIPAWLLVQ